MNDLRHEKKANIIYKKGCPEPAGAVVKNGGINFSFITQEGTETSLVLYDRAGALIDEFPIPAEMYYGDVAAVWLKGLRPDEFMYCYRAGKELVSDPCGRIILGKEAWGTVPEQVNCAVAVDKYSWNGDRRPDIPFSESIIYRLHVRGFTMASGLEEKKRGTFAGIQAKIPYLKELGVTMVELMPAYEFHEVKKIKSKADPRYQRSAPESAPVNYWGYTDGFWYAPKAAYSAGKTTECAAKELKDLVKALHKEGMELSMEFFFPRDMHEDFVLACLREWVESYHLDGIRISADERFVHAAMADPRLAGVKLTSWIWPYNGRTRAARKGVLQDDFMIAVRRFVKGDEGQAGVLTDKMFGLPESGTILHYLAKHDTFSLLDTVSYDRKHNEANGEANQDGAVYNYSWNCGAEGETRSRKVIALRKRQMKNAIALLFLSAGTPVIEAGDERAQTRQGNNNPYCQDNETNWIDWHTGALAREILAFTKAMISFRRSHPIFMKNEQLSQSDYKAIGQPELSFHGEAAWYPQFDHMSKELAVMINGKYADEKDGLFYIAANMSPGGKKFGIPSPGTGKKWEAAITTGTEADVSMDKAGRILTLKARTLAVLITVQA